MLGIYFFAIILSLIFNIQIQEDMSVQHFKKQNFSKQPLIVKMVFCTVLGFIAGRYANLFNNHHLTHSDRADDSPASFIGWI